MGLHCVDHTLQSFRGGRLFMRQDDTKTGSFAAGALKMDLASEIGDNGVYDGEPGPTLSWWNRRFPVEKNSSKIRS